MSKNLKAGSTSIGPFEIRNAEYIGGKVKLDEVIGRGVHVHFETMSKRHLWCGLVGPDGEALHVNVWVTKSGKLRWRAEPG